MQEQDGFEVVVGSSRWVLPEDVELEMAVEAVVVGEAVIEHQETYDDKH